MSINVADYWPFFTNGEMRIFEYQSLENMGLPHFTSVYTFDYGHRQSMLLNNFAGNGEFLNRWYYNYKPGFGIAEWRDDYPGNKKVVCDPPIGWGDKINIGDNFQNKPKFDAIRSWPWATGEGTQIVQFENLLPEMAARGKTYSDVLVFSYLQSWNGKAATGARHWMAKGVGPIAMAFITQAAPNSIEITTTAKWEANVISQGGVNASV